MGLLPYACWTVYIGYGHTRIHICLWMEAKGVRGIWWLDTGIIRKETISMRCAKHAAVKVRKRTYATSNSVAIYYTCVCFVELKTDTHLRWFAFERYGKHLCFCFFSFSHLFKNLGSSRGFAFVEFNTEEEASRWMEYKQVSMHLAHTARKYRQRVDDWDKEKKNKTYWRVSKFTKTKNSKI